MVHTAAPLSHPSVDSPSSGTCIRIQLPGGHPRFPLPDELPDTCLQPGLTPDQLHALEGPRLAAVLGLAASDHAAQHAPTAQLLGRASLALEAAPPVPAGEPGLSSASVQPLVRRMGAISRTRR